MWMKLEQVPLSSVNRVLAAALLAGILLAGVLGLWPQAVILAAILLAGLGGAYAARRPSASDVHRINAIEYRDERDRMIARDGLAVVGVVALVMSLITYMLGLVLYPDLRWPLLAQVVLLNVCWGIANHVAVRRH